MRKNNIFFRLQKAIECRLYPKKFYIKQKFKARTGRKLDLDNPITFSEKIQWLKLYYRNPLLTKMADKVESKEIVKNKIGQKYVIPNHSVYENAENIVLRDLPKSFALKATHGSGWNIIERSKENTSEEQIQNYFKFWLKKSYYLGSKEWAYKNIKPRVVCEKLLFDTNGKLPMDYKIFCFNGKAKYIQIDHERFKNHTRSFYDEKWIKQDFTIGGYEMHLKKTEEPKNLKLMIELANILSEDLPFLRVDLYNINGSIYVGELTCYPGNGLEVFSDFKWDLKFGSLLNLK